MAIIKCKMCGGDIALNEEKTFGTCEYCGSTMTLPKVSDDQRAARFNRGNHFRRQGEFDKALAVYESIVREDDADAEAHWCCALCRFGIEYVEDPNTFEYLPTCHRASFDSFLEDVDYKAALENSDGITRRQYQKDAAKIAEVQRGILATSQNEEPFDVFICYKETDDETRERTRDSLDAQEIYYQLTQEGYRVFFARITLEDKAGTEYEPYIFAALNSAKVMVAIGSKPEYFNAVWVKNEWSRFLAMMRKDRSKLLLPCYKNMDPYDLPEQLGVLQSYDMAKIGFVQDLIRGIKKVLARDEAKHTQTAKESVAVNSGSLNVAPLLKRAFMYLEDGNWTEADAYCEKVLDHDPENAEAYLGKLLAELHICRQDGLLNCAQPFDESNNFKKALRFGDETLAAKLKEYVAYIKERNETKRITDIYNHAVSVMKSANTEESYMLATKSFHLIPGFKDADDLARQCIENAEECRKIAEENRSIAEENRRIEEEKRRIEEERERRKIAAIVAALKSGSSATKEPTLEEKLARAKAKIQSMTLVQNEFDMLLAQASQLQREQAEVVSHEASLISERTKLGLLAHKEKKRIDEALSVLSTRKRELAVRIEKNEQQRYGFTSKEDIEREIMKETVAVSDFEAQIKTNQDNPEKTYSYEEAIELYFALPEVTCAVNNIYQEAPIVLYLQGKTDSLLFGKYIQKNNGVPEPIEWQILERKRGRILVISRYALDCRRFNETKADVTWETCSLRKWLNGTFLYEAFSDQEQAIITSAIVSADNNPDFCTSPGNSTTDRVFLLSIKEANKYFNSNEERKCAPTDYAIAQRTYTCDKNMKDGKATCLWRLRSPGNSSSYAAVVNVDGSIYCSGDGVSHAISAIRPAMWINLES